MKNNKSEITNKQETKFEKSLGSLNSSPALRKENEIEKEISELNNKIKDWEKLFEEEQITKEQAQEEVRSLREKLDNNQKDVLGIMKLVLDSPEMDRKRVNEVYFFINLVENKLKRLEGFNQGSLSKEKDVLKKINEIYDKNPRDVQTFKFLLDKEFSNDILPHHK